MGIFRPVLTSYFQPLEDTLRLTIALLLSGLIAAAQTHQHGPSEAEHIDPAKLPPPQRIDGIGQAHIPITTKSPQAQQWFDQGLALIHCFWDYEALRAFEESIRLDPDCAMCHWGMFQALDFTGEHDLATAELARAKDLAPKASDREQRYIRATTEQQDAVHQKKTGEEATQAFIKEMEALEERYPDDLQAKLFLASQLIDGYDNKGDPRPGALYGQALLRNLLHDYPSNAAANHYWVHAVEGSGHPEWALESAEKLGKLAPASGHVVHMPGHIFFRLGDYERARQIFLEAARVDHDYMDQQHVSIRNNWNYSHNLSYLIADCAEAGRYREALDHAAALQGTADDPDQSLNPGFYILQVGSSAARLDLRFGAWDDAIKQPINFGVPDEKLSVAARGYRDGMIAYARGMKAAESGELSEADRQSDTLDALLWRLSQEKVDDEAKHVRDRVAGILETASLDLRGNIAGYRKDLPGMQQLLDKAADHERDLGYAEPPQYSRPELESLGYALIRAGKFADAREAFHKELHDRPKTGFALYGIALAWDKEGNGPEAGKAYREFLDAWKGADRDLPQIRAAEAAISGR
ncbi:MAG TPA: tetratricopeptide repeat protein [Bryobacteraceae bacterium]|nr:tetratricopeptide repeat protein [Bryobacteraceae bacterium]